MAEYILDTTDGIYNARTTGELVRCKDCELYDREEGLCYRDPEHCGYYRPACDDGFCAWAEPKEES